MADIMIRHLNKSYGAKRVLSDVCLRFPEGRVCCIMAPSGAGKTTLLRLMLGLEKPDGGSISGLERARLAAVFQEDRLLESADAARNLRLVSPGLDGDALSEAFSRFGLSGSERQPVRELSGGMRRRVALLRALMSDWDVLVLDEPFSGLDADTRARIAGELLRMRADRTVIMVSHDPEEAKLMGAEIFALNPRRTEACPAQK